MAEKQYRSFEDRVFGSKIVNNAFRGIYILGAGIGVMLQEFFVFTPSVVFSIIHESEYRAYQSALKKAKESEEKEAEKIALALTEDSSDSLSERIEVDTVSDPWKEPVLVEAEEQSPWDY